MKPGVYAGLSREDYIAIDAVNVSRLLKMQKSPRHYLANSSTSSRPKAIGTWAHLAILEPEKFSETTAVWDGPVRRGKSFDAFIDQNPGKEVLLESEFRAVSGMRTALLNDSGCRVVLAETMKEVTLVWFDEVTGLLCKARVDGLSDNVLLDLKTTETISLGAFFRSCARFDYNLRMGFYRRGCRACGLDPKRVVLVVVESVPPHDCGIVNIPEHILDDADDYLSTLLDKVSFCVKSGHWPGVFGDGQVDLEVPGWKYREMFGDEESVEVTSE